MTAFPPFATRRLATTSGITVHRAGEGPPMVLLHALGSSSRSWEPVLHRLAQEFDVIALDLPGCGESAPIDGQREPTPAALAAVVDAALDELDVGAPHVVGNSLGGWVGLELAQRRPLASLTLLAPAGLWRDHTPMYCRVSLRATRWLALHAAGLLERLVEHRPGRYLVLAQSHGRPGRITPEQGRAAINAIRRCDAFDALLDATIPRHYAPRTALDVARITVAFGTRERILLRRAWRSTAQLPATVTVRRLPGCGHLPMADDPDLVADLIVSSAR